MSDADRAFAEAELMIAKARETGAKRLDFDQEETWELQLLPEWIGDLSELETLHLANTLVSDLGPLSGLTGLRVLGLDYTPVSDLRALSGLTGLASLWLDKTPVSDLRPIRELRGLVENPRGLGLTFKGCAAAQRDTRIAEIAEIEDPSERARKLFNYLEDWGPPGEGDSPPTKAPSGYGFNYGRDYGGTPPPRAASETSPIAVSVKRIGTKEIRAVLTESYPDLQDRAQRLVALVQQERAAHAMIARPNEIEDLKAYEEKEEFLKTMEAGLVSLHEELPKDPPAQISEEKAQRLRDKLVELAKLTDAAIRYLDEDKGTYGGLYKIGLISGVAGLLALVPGVTFLTGAALPTLVFIGKKL